MRRLGSMSREEIARSSYLEDGTKMVLHPSNSGMEDISKVDESALHTDLRK